MDAREFQDTARRLMNGNAEGDWRSAASRSYYFVFHFFHKFFRARGLDLGQGGQAHNNLYVGLNNCGQAIMQGLATKVDQLRDNRIRADYDLASMVVQSLSQTSIAAADLIVSDFQSALAIVPAAQIVAGATQYLQSIGRIPKKP